MEESKVTKKITAKKAVEVPVFSLDGTKTGTKEVSAVIFGAKINEALVAQYVRVFLHNQRQGNASAKTRAEVEGTTKKVYRQKGTGRARHGSDKANLFRGGGATFGPLVKDFELSMNKKQKKLALYSVLSKKAHDKHVMILDASSIAEKPSTKTIVKTIEEMKLAGKTLFVLSKVDNGPFVRSARNIESVSIMQAHTLNGYDALNTKNIVFVNDAVDVLTSHFTTK